jgi:hypothetical protein
MLSGFNVRECRMNTGKTLFAQVMEFVPWKTFARIIERHKGDAGVRTLSCADLFRVMAFSQLTWRESLRDIEVCLEANQSKLFHMGIATPPARSTLADALNLRDWRIYHALALRLISRARALYAEDPSVLGLDASVYALDSTTIDLCLSLFDWAPFRSTKAAIKLHTLLDLRGAIPAFIHISDGKLHDVNVLDILLVEAGSFYIMDRGYLDFMRLYAMHRAGAFFVTRAKENMDARRVYSLPVDRASGIICDQRVMLNGFYSAENYPDHLRRIRFNDPETGKTLVFLTNNTVLQMDQAAPAHQALSGYQRERREKPSLVCHRHLCVDRHRQEGTETRGLALHLSTDSVGIDLRENRDFMRTSAKLSTVRTNCHSLTN